LWCERFVMIRVGKKSGCPDPCSAPIPAHQGSDGFHEEYFNVFYKRTEHELRPSLCDAIGSI
jgi:hypothetical protein